MMKKSNLKKPICALATMTLTASLLLPGAAFAEQNNTADGSFSLNNSSYLSNTGWTGSISSATGAGEIMSSDQSIFYDNATSFGYNWMYPADKTGIQSSPAISFGWNWTNGYEGAGNVPVEVFRDNARNRSSNSGTQMKNIDTSVAYTTSDVTGDYATGYTVYIHNTQWAGMDTTPTATIKVITSTSANPGNDDTSGAMSSSDMSNRTETSVADNVFTSTAGSTDAMQNESGAWGQWLSTVSIGGSTWNVYRTTTNADHTVTSANANNHVTYTYVRTANTESISLNLTDFVKNLLDRGELTMTGNYVSGVKFGTDVLSGSGKLTVNEWNIGVQ
ncbi:GH12 family glycosyl hydrolase domain-containing protein [Paenibacillus sp. WLX1005]|uniref:GH12 family glycosyl hydrolase domain-containing protein n=1 Tax=Paenibacillus sp. WLX1005 TaxID=3243766 RepID=UPI003983FA89